MRNQQVATTELSKQAQIHLRPLQSTYFRPECGQVMTANAKIQNHLINPLTLSIPTDTRPSFVVPSKKPANVNTVKNVNSLMACTSCAIYNAIPNTKPNCVVHSIAAASVHTGRVATLCTMSRRHATTIVPYTLLWPVPPWLPATLSQ